MSTEQNGNSDQVAAITSITLDIILEAMVLDNFSYYLK